MMQKKLINMLKKFCSVLSETIHQCKLFYIVFTLHLIFMYYFTSAANYLIENTESLILMFYLFLSSKKVEFQLCTNVKIKVNL